MSRADLDADLRFAAAAVLRDALDEVTVSPCDANNDDVRATHLYGPMAKLWAALDALASQAPAVQPIGFVVGHANAPGQRFWRYSRFMERKSDAEGCQRQWNAWGAYAELIPVYATPSPQGAAEDAARWRETLKHLHVSASGDIGARFTLRYLSPIEGVDLMRGGVAGHFTAAIDAARKAGKP